MPPKDDPEVTALKKEVNDLIAKFQVRRNVRKINVAKWDIKLKFRLLF